jgi:small-conductance mechanosensitive channel
MVDYVYGLFTIATVTIAFFITIYAYLFLIKTRSHRERRPWDFLFVASILFLIFELVTLFVYFGVIQFVGVDLIMVSKIFEFLYSGFVLLAFISQHDLILRSHLILISKKEDEDSIKITVEGKKGKE